jgi:phosphatidylinositol alpha-1,6-mannosyltransferase
MVMDCRSRWFGLEQEGFGIVFVEAAACGLAQIAGRSGGSDDAVFDGVTGIVLDSPRSADALADAIEGLMLDRERRELYAHQARALASSQFSWDALAHELSTGLEPYDHFSIASSRA